MKRFCLMIIALLAVPLFAAPAFAYRYWGEKPLAMGGAYSAIANDLNAMHWNPAGLAYLNDIRKVGLMFNYERQEHLLGDYAFAYQDEIEEDTQDDVFGDEVFFNDDNGGYDPDKKMVRDWYHIGVADGFVNPLFTVGLAFTGLNFPNHTFREGDDYWVDLTFAGGAADIFYYGFTFRWVDVQPEENGEPDGDVGVLFNAVDLVHIALVGRNIFGNDEPMMIRRELALGVSGHILDYAALSVEATKVFDVTDVDGTFNFGFGVEGMVADVLALRGGFHWDQVTPAKQYSAGLAYVDPQGSLGYTFQGDVDEVKNFIHSIQITVYLP